MNNDEHNAWLTKFHQQSVEWLLRDARKMKSDVEMLLPRNLTIRYDLLREVRDTLNEVLETR